MVVLAGVASQVVASTTPASAAAALRTTNSASPRPGYEAAKVQWLGASALVSGAGQNASLLLAVADLRRGQHMAGNTSGYGAAIAAIIDFATIPITSVTQAENAQIKTDLAEVNKFFGLPRSTWNGECISSGSGVDAAASAWATEPSGTSHGTRARPLKAAVSDLSRGFHTDTGDRSCYPAAIADLKNLESATKSEIAASSQNTSFDAYTPAGLVGAEIVYLNGFFSETQILQNPVLTSGEQ
jgi:hypothetical protein